MGPPEGGALGRAWGHMRGKHWDRHGSTRGRSIGTGMGPPEGGALGQAWGHLRGEHWDRHGAT
eukprot:355233-Chlamydomonas_euryale.AAC.6